MIQNENTQTARDLIYLVSCAVNEIQPGKERYDAMDDTALFKFACRQKLAATVGRVLRQIMPLPEHWKEVMGKGMRQQALYDTERAGIFHALDENGIWYLPLKGALLKDIYPKTTIREMSDNDILCDRDRMEDVRSVMEELGYTCELFGKYNHDKYTKMPLSFEMHTQLFVAYDVPVIAEYYMSIKEKLLKDSDNRCGYHMTDEDFYLYILCHIYKHYIKSGTGLRSLLDIYIYNKVKGDSLDRRYIADELEKLGVVKFEKDFRKLADRVFSGDELTDGVMDDLDTFISSGCFGSGRNRIENRLSGDDVDKAKRLYLVRRIFPDEIYLKSFYPTVYRHRILYPFLVVYRPFKGFVTKRQKLLREFRYVKEYRQDDDKKSNEK